MEGIKKDFANMESTMISAKENMVKFTENSNNAAGTRLRKNMQEIKQLAQKIRLSVQDAKNSSK